MKKISIQLLSAFVVFVFCATTYAGDASYQAAQDQIKQGELRQALTTLKQAVDAEPQNKQYAQEFMLLRQIIAMQQQLDREKNPAKWNGYAQRLRTYYDQNGADGMLLDLDRKIYAKTPSISNAGMLAESLMATENDGEALQLLSGISNNSRSALSNVLFGLALHRNGKTDEATTIASTYVTPQAKKPLTPPILVRLARLEAALGKKDAAIASLKQAFEQTPPGAQTAMRERCKTVDEFAELQNDDEFKVALNATSKVTESACSGGSSCGTCPMRSKCQGQ